MTTFAVRTKPEVLEVKDLVNAFIYATDWLGVYVEEVNALNVYPVPDGDTGTNMHLTMQSVRRQLKESAPNTPEELAHALAYGSLLGARGNSGVILSQVLKGFAEVIKEQVKVDAKAIIAALKSTSKFAYEAVVRPVEGTILTVVRRAAEAVEDTKDANPLEVLKRAWRAGKEALDETPEMLPILKQAGVVDSGGLGFLRVLEGVIASFEGTSLPAPPEITVRAQQNFEEEEYGFCTEFLIAESTASSKEIQELVAPFGDSLLVVGAEGFIKGHIHTQEPEKLLALVAKYGKMMRSKVEDMSEQHSEILDDVDPSEVTQAANGMVAVSQGYGVTKIFRQLGARIVGGGQTNNPSVEDIADAVRSVAAERVFVFPNNKNIIMAAERVQDLVQDKEVIVLPTRNLGQGLAATVLFNDQAEKEDLLEEFHEAISHARTLEVTTASRDAEIDGVKVQDGQSIGLLDGKLVQAADSPEAALKALLSDIADDAEIATLFYNNEVSKDQVEALCAELADDFDDLELELHAGGPDVYQYVMAVE